MHIRKLNLVKRKVGSVTKTTAAPSITDTTTIADSKSSSVQHLPPGLAPPAQVLLLATPSSVATPLWPPRTQRQQQQVERVAGAAPLPPRPPRPPPARSALAY